MKSFTIYNNKFRYTGNMQSAYGMERDLMNCSIHLTVDREIHMDAMLCLAYTRKLQG